MAADVREKVRTVVVVVVVERDGLASLRSFVAEEENMTGGEWSLWVNVHGMDVLARRE